MNIVLLGANGRTGREVLGRALSAGDTVTALVRAARKLGDLGHERLEIRVGNACDPKVLEALLPGHDVVISTLGPRLPTISRAAVACFLLAEARQSAHVRQVVGLCG